MLLLQYQIRNWKLSWHLIKSFDNECYRLSQYIHIYLDTPPRSRKKNLIFWGSLESLRAIMYSSQERTCQNNLLDIIEALHWVWWSPTERWTPTESWPQFWNLLTTESDAKVLWTWQLVFFRNGLLFFSLWCIKGGGVAGMKLSFRNIKRIPLFTFCMANGKGSTVLLFLGEPLLFQNMQFLIIWSYTDSTKVGRVI